MLQLNIKCHRKNVNKKREKSTWEWKDVRSINQALNFLQAAKIIRTFWHISYVIRVKSMTSLSSGAIWKWDAHKLLQTEAVDLFIYDDINQNFVNSSIMDTFHNVLIIDDIKCWKMEKNRYEATSPRSGGPQWQ